jgi:GTPase SAR1 family protein
MYRDNDGASLGEVLSSKGDGSDHESESDDYSTHMENITEDICVEQYKKALRENAQVTVGIVKAMTIGPPRVGKTCLRSLLLGRVPPRESPSTSVLKTAETVSMNTSSRKEPTIVSECISTSGWEVIDTTTGIISLLKYLQQGKHSRVGRGNEEVAQSRSRYPSSTHSKDGKDDVPESSMTTLQVETQELRQLDSYGVDDELACGEKSFAEEIYHAISHSSDHAGVQLLDADLLQFLDTGGQISYHDILPVFITTPAIYLHVFSITEPLDKRPTDCIQLEGSGEWKSVTSPLTTLEMISRSAMTVHSLANKNMTLPCLVDEKYYPKPKMVVVGTHVDQFLEAHKSTRVVEDELSRISRKLDSALSGLKFSIIKSKLPMDKERMFHPVDNYLYSKDTSCMDQQQKDTIENLRKEMEGIASRMKFTIPVPWYLQQLLLTKESEKIPFYRYGELLKLCKENGVVKTDEEFYAMITLFHNLGLLVHHDVGTEPKEEGAHNANSTCLVFSNPSFLYENISRLYTVQFEECHGWKLSFRSQGLLQASVLKEINVDKRLPQEWFMDLLVTLFIGAEVTRFKERTLFVPSVLLPDKIPTSSNCCNKLSLMFERPSAFPSHRNDTYIPCGVFTGTIARLQSLKDWRVSHFDLISRTMIIFEVGRGTFVQMTDSTQYITIEVLNDADVDTCQKLRNLVFNCIQESYKYLFKEDAQFLIGLPCPRKDHQSHIARLSTTGEYSRFVICCPTTRVLHYEKVLTEKELNIFLDITHPAVKKEYHTPRTITQKKSDNEARSPTGTVNPLSTIMQQPLPKSAPIVHPCEEWEKMKPTEIHLRRHICKNIAGNWEEICTYLGIANEEVKGIKQEYQNRTKQASFESIMLWHRGNSVDHPPTWRVLLKALEDAEYKELAKELREKLPSGKLED